MLDSILGFSEGKALWLGFSAVALLLILSWYTFKVAPVIIKTTVGFILFSLIIFTSAIWVGGITLKKFVNDWMAYEVSRLKEGAFVMLESKKSTQRTFIEMFSTAPGKILEDRLAKTLFDFIAIADETGKIKMTNERIMERVPIPEKKIKQEFIRTQNGVYLITVGLAETGSGEPEFITVGEKADIRIVPALADMLSAKDVIIEEQKDEGEQEGKDEPEQKSVALISLGKGIVLKIFPNDENIYEIVLELVRGAGRGIGISLAFAVLFFALLSLSYIRRPLAELMGASSEVEKGNFEYEIKWRAKGDIGKLISTFNEMIRGLRRRDAQIKYRNELLSSIKEFARGILNEFDKEKIFQMCVETAGVKTGSKCAIFWSDKVKGEVSISKEDIENLRDGDSLKKNGRIIIVYDIGIERETGKVLYGKFVAERQRDFIPEEKEFFSSLISYVSSACLRSDYVSKLQLLQSTDSTTGLFNLTFFKSSIKREMSILRRFQRNFGIVFIDIQNSSEIIEKFGYIIWEDIIKAIAVIMKKSVRTYDVPARIGEDKFALLFPNTDGQNVKVVEERLKNQIISAPEIPALPELELKANVESTATDIITPEEILEKVEERTGKTQKQ